MKDKTSLIKIIDHSMEWEKAVKLGVDLLLKADIATEKLADAIIETTKNLGPYYVLMPKVALAHTSPGEYNKKVGLSLVVFKEDVKFSNEDKHNVKLLFTLSAIDSNSHMNILQEFATIFQDESIIDKIIKSNNEEQIYLLIKKIFDKE